MIGLVLGILPALLWDEGAATAPQLVKAGIREIAVTRDAGAWSSTGITAVRLDPSELTKTETPGVDYKVGTAGATAAPWVESNLWRMIREPGGSFLYEVPPAALPLAMAEAYTGGARTFFRVKPEDLDSFAAVYRFLRELPGPPLGPRVNFTLIDDRSPEIAEVMNLLVRRNLLFGTASAAASLSGVTVRLGSPEYPKDSAGDPYVFAEMVRSRIGDDNRLVRIYGSETILVRLFGDERHSRAALLQYGPRAAEALRVRVLGAYSRIRISALGQDTTQPADVVVENGATEFTVPVIRTFALIDLEGS